MARCCTRRSVVEAVAELFSSGRAADLIVALMVLKALVFVAYYHRTSCGTAPIDLLSNLLAGICPLLAQHGSVEHVVGLDALFLSAALQAHSTDLRRR
jgi:hypothetical protein